MSDQDGAEDGRAFKGEPPELDEALIWRIVGKRLLIGLTYLKQPPARIDAVDR
jgi:hypothetical protein